MTATVIRDFLVSLGYQVNKASEQSFNDSLKKTAGNAVKLGLAIEAAAAAVTGAVVKMAQGMEQSYYQSKRLGGSVKDINAVGYAISQVGGSADAAKQSMENIASFMRRLPGGKSYIQKLVGSSVDAGNVPAVMGALAKQFANMPFAQAKVRADFLGIDENTLQAMIRDGGRYYDEYQKLAKRAGVDQQKYAENSKDLMVKVRSLGMSFELLAIKIGSALIDKAGPYIDKFKNWIDRNFDSITKTVSKVADVIMRLSDRIGAFVGRVMEWYDKLDPKSRSLVNTIGGVTGAIILLNKAFGSSPVGIILSLASAIAVLYDDYRRWKETDQVGLVDWSKWEPTIQSVTNALETISNWLKTLAGDDAGGIGSLQTAMGLFATFMATKWVASLLTSFGRVKGGWLNLVAAFGTLAAADIYGTYQEGAELQRQVDAGNGKEWLEDRNSKAFGTRLWRGAVNWGYRQFGAEEPYDENMRTKSSSGKGSRSGGGGREIGRSLTDDEKAEMATAIRATAKKLGVSPEDIATAMSYETGGTLNPWQKGPKTKWGRHRGLIQWGEPQRAKYGVTQNSTITEQVQAAGEYLRDAGVTPGMGLLDIYSAINAGRVGRYNASDVAAGGAPGTVADKVNNQMGGHKNALNRLESPKKKKEQERFVTDAVASLATVKPPKDGPFAQDWQTPTTPLMPDNISNNSNATMNLNVENKFMGSVSEKQVQNSVEKGGRVLLRNMQPAIR